MSKHYFTVCRDERFNAVTSGLKSKLPHFSWHQNICNDLQKLMDLTFYRNWDKVHNNVLIHYLSLLYPGLGYGESNLLGNHKKQERKETSQTSHWSITRQKFTMFRHWLTHTHKQTGQLQYHQLTWQHVLWVETKIQKEIHMETEKGKKKRMPLTFGRKSNPGPSHCNILHCCLQEKTSTRNLMAQAFHNKNTITTH